jgi:transcriptional regulator with XRE-family HTH domain
MALKLTPTERAAMGARLRAARHTHDLTIRDVAAATGKSVTAAAAWETSGYLPGADARAALARLYKLPEAVLFAEYTARLDAERALLTAS